MPEVYRTLPGSFYALARASTTCVLLESSLPSDEEHFSYLLSDPKEVLTLSDEAGAEEFFSRLGALQRQGCYAAGFLSYELGYHLVGVSPQISPPSDGLSLPLAQFGIFEEAVRFNHLTGEIDPKAPLAPSEHGPAEVSLQGAELSVDLPTYLRRFGRVRDYLEAGDCYQINLTHRYRFSLEGQAIDLYRRLRQAQPVSYGGYLKLPACEIVTLSPELFIKKRGSSVTTRPMKGTWRRAATVVDDLRAQESLREDAKSQAENVMIVDLLRNDLGRVCRAGSIDVPSLFAVETFRGLHQLTSTVTGTLADDVDLYGLLGALFPCGSVTGAPKRRAMEIIAELEPERRGVYSGSIGLLKPGGDAIFNVAIRSVVMSGSQGVMGVGSGIVYDSDPHEEYEESVLKGRFLTAKPKRFELFETLRWQGAYHHLARHLDRLESSASYFGFAFSRDSALALLEQRAVKWAPSDTYRAKLTLAQEGSMRVDARPFPDVGGPHMPAKIALAATRVVSNDVFLYHKTTNRARYDAAADYAQRNGLADLVFLNERAEVTEGAISTIFASVGASILTPPVRCGLLPGVLRAHLLDTNPNFTEQVLSVDDLLLADALYIGNALRGLRRVELVGQTRTVPA